MAITVHGNNTARYFQKIFRQKLLKKYPEGEVDSLYRIVLSDILFWTYSETLLLEGKRFSESEILKLHKALKKLEEGLPIQLVTGITEFYGLVFRLNNQVLFPRPETEYLIHLISKIEDFYPVNILDVCSGSGCISIALKSVFSSSKVLAYELSKDALLVSKENSDVLNLEVEFVEKDVLTEDWTALKVDLMVSNPPYIPYTEMGDIDSHVWEHEPEMALMVPNEKPLVFYRRILEKGVELLNEKGHLFLEINPNFANEMLSLGQDFGFESNLILDLENKNRFLHCQWPRK